MKRSCPAEEQIIGAIYQDESLARAVNRDQSEKVIMLYGTL